MSAYLTIQIFIREISLQLNCWRKDQEDARKTITGSQEPLAVTQNLSVVELLTDVQRWSIRECPGRGGGSRMKE
jgi:hypothetical protein